MPDEPFVISPSAPPPPTEADYEAIHAAVMQTVRGRWFLSEYARRNRHADTSLILAAIDRVEALWHERGAAPSPVERVHFDLVEMAKAIAQTRSEIAAIKPDSDAKGSLSEASEELDSIVHTTEKATSDILAAAEQVQEIAWTLRERGADPASCDALDQRATEIYSACSFQDLTGQRTRKVVDVLRFLEDRIRAMIEIWGNAGPAPAGAAAAPHLGLNAAEQMAQPEIDRMMPVADEPAVAEETALAIHSEVPADRDAGTRIDARIDTPADTRVDSQGYPQIYPDDAPGDGIADAVAAQVFETGNEAPIADAVSAAAASHDDGAVSAEPMAEIVSAPAVVGATALALEPSAIAAAPTPEPTPEAEVAHEPIAAPEPQAKPQAEPQAELEAQVQAEAQAQAEPQAAPSLADEPAAGDDRSDPAVMLKRILALIRTPNTASLEVNVADPPPGGSDDASAVSALVMTLAVQEARVADGAVAAASESSAVAALPVVEPPVVEAPVAAAPVAATPAAHAAVAEVAPVAASASAEAADKGLRSLTVDQAVSDLLGDGLIRADAAPPEWAPPAAVDHGETTLTLAVPEFTIAPAPVPPAPPEPAPLPTAPEPAPAALTATPAALDLPALEPQPLEPSRAEAPPPADDLPAIEPVAQEAPAEPVAAMAPPAAEAEATPIVTATFRPTSQPISPALRPLLAAIAALSDEEKLALFS